MDKKAGTENYTIVFSREQLTTPAFFDVQATGKPLDDSEQSEFNDFLAKFKTASPTIEVNSKNAADPFVTVKVPPSNSDAPVIFEIRIQHK